MSTYQELVACLSGEKLSLVVSITMALSLPLTLSHPPPVTHRYHLGSALCDPGKGEKRKAKAVICGGTGLGDMSV